MTVRNWHPLVSGTATPSWSEPSWSKLCEFSRHSQTDACRSRKTSSVSSPQFQRYGTFWPPTRDCFRGRASLQIEVIALRHQFHVLERSVKRPKLTASDRFFWACLAARKVKILERAESMGDVPTRRTAARKTLHVNFGPRNVVLLPFWNAFPG